MSMEFMRLGTIVFFVTPSSVELSVRRADLGWGQPILMIAWRRGNIYLAVMKRASITNLDVEDMTNLMIWVRVRSSLLLASMGTFLERNILDPAQLRKCFPQNDRRGELPPPPQGEQEEIPGENLQEYPKPGATIFGVKRRISLIGIQT